MKRLVLVVSLLCVCSLCMADEIVGEKVSDTEIKITRTTTNIIKVSALVNAKDEIVKQKENTEALYTKRMTNLNLLLLDVETQIQRAKDVGLET